MREGPPLLVPVIEGGVSLVLLAIAAKPGPVPRGARPLILTLFGVLIAANTAAAVRLVMLVLRSTPAGRVAADRDAAPGRGGIVLATNVVTFGLLYWQLDSGGPDGRLIQPGPTPTSSSRRRSPTAWPPGLAAAVPGPPIRGVHERDGVQPDRHHAADRPGQGAHGGAVADLTAVLVLVLSRVINILPS